MFFSQYENRKLLLPAASFDDTSSRAKVAVFSEFCRQWGRKISKEDAEELVRELGGDQPVLQNSILPD
jgi:hypothetical protein